MACNQERENFYYDFNVHEGFISAVSVLNDWMKILVGLGKFNRVVCKDLGTGCYCKNSIS